jgi:hypothetical protein
LLTIQIWAAKILILVKKDFAEIERLWSKGSMIQFLVPKVQIFNTLFFFR